jgi:hypothetical protein
LRFLTGFPPTFSKHPTHILTTADHDPPSLAFVILDYGAQASGITHFI